MRSALVGGELGSELGDQRVFVLEHFFHVLDSRGLIHLHFQLSVRFSEFARQSFLLLADLCDVFGASVQHPVLEFGDLLSELLVLHLDAFVLDQYLLDLDGGPQCWKLSLDRCLTRQSEVSIHDELFEVFHVLQSFVILHEVDVGPNLGVLLFSVVHEHLDKDTGHAVEDLQLVSKRCPHLALHVVQNLLHLLLGEQLSVFPVQAWVAERAVLLTAFHELVRMRVPPPRCSAISSAKKS